MFGGNMDKETLILTRAKEVIEAQLEIFQPRLDELLAKKGYKKNGKKNALHDKMERTIKDCVRSISIEHPVEMRETIKAFNIPSELPIYPLDCDYCETTLEEMLPSHSRLKNNIAFEKLCIVLYDISNKGIGKGEVLSAFLFRNSVSVDSGRDGGFSCTKGRIKTAEIKAERASLKGTESARKDVIDSLNKELLKGTIIFDEESPDTISEYFKRLDNISVANREKLVKDWLSLTADERKQMVGAMIHQRYQEIDEFDSYAHWRKDKKNNTLSVVIINDFSDIEELGKRFKYFPQTSRGGGTQALGDGYTDANINKELLRMQK